MKWFLSTETTVHLGLLFIRVGIGSVFVIHGFGKLTGGMAQWHWLGSQMAHFGITFLPTVWGFVAVCSEFIGGTLLILGLATRLAAFFIGCVMLTALAYHVNKGDAFSTYSHPLSLLIVFIGIIFAGPGRYSLDHYLHEKREAETSFSSD